MTAAPGVPEVTTVVDVDPPDDFEALLLETQKMMAPMTTTTSTTAPPTMSHFVVVDMPLSLELPSLLPVEPDKVTFTDKSKHTVSGA